MPIKVMTLSAKADSFSGHRMARWPVLAEGPIRALESASTDERIELHLVGLLVPEGLAVARPAQCDTVSHVEDHFWMFRLRADVVRLEVVPVLTAETTNEMVTRVHGLAPFLPFVGRSNLVLLFHAQPGPFGEGNALMPGAEAAGHFPAGSQFPHRTMQWFMVNKRQGLAHRPCLDTGAPQGAENSAWAGENAVSNVFGRSASPIGVDVLGQKHQGRSGRFATAQAGRARLVPSRTWIVLQKSRTVTEGTNADKKDARARRTARPTHCVDVSTRSGRKASLQFATGAADSIQVLGLRGRRMQIELERLETHKDYPNHIVRRSKERFARALKDASISTRLTLLQAPGHGEGRGRGCERARTSKDPRS